MLNKYIWNNYLKSSGNATVKLFESIVTKGPSKDYINGVINMRKIYCPSRNILNDMNNQLLKLQDNSYLLEYGEYSINSGLTSIWEEFKSYKLSDPEICSIFLDNIDEFTTSLFIELNELYIPYYFKYNFNILQMIGEEFNLKIPKIPHKKDYKDRFYYYGELCESFLEFRDKNDLSPYEMCAFLYDFAPKYIGGLNSYIIKELPEPKSAYFFGAHKYDNSLCEDPNVIEPWQCNPETRAGDMIVMYIRTPISSINSIWRSISVGFNDPFFYYYRMTYISNPTPIKNISQMTLKLDEITSQMPIVRKNMQGINGVELTPSQYNHLVDLSKANVPKLEYILGNNNMNITCEKDVENKLIEKLIIKLEYSEKHYTKQLQIRLGNNNIKLIPDFVLLPNISKGHHSAFAIIEAKLKITNEKSLLDAKTQARSYAKQLSVRYCIIASKDKIWISCPEDDFDKDIFSCLWEDLNNPDIFSKLYKLIGKNSNKNIKRGLSP